MLSVDAMTKKETAQILEELDKLKASLESLSLYLQKKTILQKKKNKNKKKNTQS
jgi:hypothetical protein